MPSFLELLKVSLRHFAILHAAVWIHLFSDVHPFLKLFLFIMINFHQLAILRDLISHTLSHHVTVSDLETDLFRKFIRLLKQSVLVMHFLLFGHLWWRSVPEYGSLSSGQIHFGLFRAFFHDLLVSQKSRSIQCRFLGRRLFRRGMLH